MASRLAKQSRRMFAVMLPVCLLVLISASPASVWAADNVDEVLELKRGDLNGQSPEGSNSDSSSKDSTNPSSKTAGSDDRERNSAGEANGGNGFHEEETDGAVRKPFNLNVQTSVMDGGADNNNLQGGANNNIFRGGLVAPGMFGSQSPQIDRNINRPVLKPGANTTELNGGLTEVQLQRLAAHDLVLIIDQSASMNSQDCPVPGMGRVGGTIMGMLLGSAGMVSRWQWCRDQTMNLAEQTQHVSQRGMSVILFSTSFEVHPKVAVSEIPAIFRQVAPHGTTNLTEPLRITINDYFARQTATRGNVKPLAIAIITDGLPSNEQNVAQVLAATAKQMRKPGDIKVTFFLIGNSAMSGQAFVNRLERNLPIVRSVSFWNLMKVGLSKALADALE